MSDDGHDPTGNIGEDCCVGRLEANEIQLSKIRSIGRCCWAAEEEKLWKSVTQDDFGAPNKAMMEANVGALEIGERDSRARSKI